MLAIHSVTNEGLDWRLHLIVDYYPYKGLSQSQMKKQVYFELGRTMAEYQNLINLFVNFQIYRWTW